MWLTPKMILVATFGTYVVIKGSLTSPIAFSFMSLFGYMQFYLQFLPNSLSIVNESFMAIQRIQNYLLAEEINLSCITHSRYEITEAKDSIIIENGNFYWDRSAEEVERIIPDNAYHLKDLNFRIKRGEMVAIIGGIGQGKSSLMYSLLG
jgi:ABC-type bacteriocin/lantibiotic exporter with double-glycine peptidase domain